VKNKYFNNFEHKFLVVYWALSINKYQNLHPVRNTKLTPHTLVINGPSLIKIISARNQDIIMVYEAVIKVDIYGVGLANTRAQL
jgi:hypothetical protein